jgi:biopolymer transport protein ExbD
MSVRLDHGEDRLDEVHQINVTPFIDVMLVLLIIFMVAAPLATVDVPVNLPVASAEAQPRPEKPLFLTIKTDLSLTFGNELVSRDRVAATLDAATQSNKDTRIFLRADRAVPYGDDDNLVSRLDDPWRFGDADDRWRAHRARQDRAVRELAAPFGHEAPHLIEFEVRGDRGQQLLRDNDGAFGDFRALRPALL